MAGKYAGRSSARFRALRGEFLRKCKASKAPCWLCGGALNYALPHPHPESFNVDHAIALSVRPELADDMNNFRPAHKACNERRGNADPELDIGVPSEVW